MAQLLRFEAKIWSSVLYQVKGYWPTLISMDHKIELDEGIRRMFYSTISDGL